MCRRAHMIQCNLSARVLLPKAWKRLVPVASLMTVRELAAARQAAEDDLLCHRPICRRFAGGASPAGVVPRLAAQSAPYLLGAIDAFGSGDRRNEPMTDIAKALSADDRKRVADYLAAFR